MGSLDDTVDVTRAEDLRRLVETAVSQYGKLDVLISNAGIGRSSRYVRRRQPLAIWAR